MKIRQYIFPLGRDTLTLVLLSLCLLTACTSSTPNSTQTLTPTPTPTPQSLYELATSSSPFLANSLSNNSALYPWREGTDKIGTCVFTGGAYHNIEPTPGDNFHACGSPGVILRDFVFQVQMTIFKGDAGGIIFRLNSNFQHYMFLINLDGSYELRADFAIIAGGSNSAIKVGLHQSNLIAIVAHGNTFDLFVNKHYITSVNDSALSAGGIGTVAHAISQPTEVAFRNAMVWTLYTQTPTPSPTHTPQSIYELATSKSTFLANSLSNNSALYTWPEGTDLIGTCLFTGGAYHNIEPTPGYFHGCGPPGVLLRDLVFQVQMTIVKGDAGGISFRWSSNDHHYMFLINQDGSYELRADYVIIQGGSNSAIKSGLNQSNLIAIAAHGNTLDLFVNKHYITSVNDSTNSEGGIGIEAHAISQSTEVAFRNAMVWIL